MFVALRMHLTAKYDYIKYNGKIRSTLKEGEKYHIFRIVDKLKTEEVIKDFFLANMVHHYIETSKLDSFIGNYATKECLAIHEKWQSWWNAFSYQMKSDISKCDSLSDALKVENGDHPKIFALYLEGKVSANTIICLLIGMPSVKKYWVENCNDTVLFKSVIEFMAKAALLVDKEPSKIKDTIKKIQESS